MVVMVPHPRRTTWPPSVGHGVATAMNYCMRKNVSSHRRCIVYALRATAHGFLCLRRASTSICRI
eukprot:2544439-Pyramimonas_sp.AAC.1